MTLIVGCLMRGWTVFPAVSTALPSSSRIRGIGLVGIIARAPISIPVTWCGMEYGVLEYGVMEDGVWGTGVWSN